MRLTWKFATTGLLALAVVMAFGPTSAFSADKSLKKVVFLANYAFHGRHSPYFVGLDKGFYREAGFEIHIAPTTGSGFVVAALQGGKADYGMADASTVVKSVAKGANVKAYGVFMDISTMGLAALTPHPTPQSLAGKTIAAGVTDSARVILPIIFGQKGIDPSSVKWEAASSGVYMSLLLDGRVDLYTATIDGDIPALTKVAAKQGKKVHFSSFAEWGYDVFGYFFVTTADKIAKNPDEVKAFAAATVKTVKYAIAHPEETARIMVKYNPTLNYDTTLTQWTQSIIAIDTAYVKKHGYGVATNDRLQRMIDLVGKAFKLDSSLKPSDVYQSGLIAK